MYKSGGIHSHYAKNIKKLFGVKVQGEYFYQMACTPNVDSGSDFRIKTDVIIPQRQ